MASITAAQAQTVVDQALQNGDRWQSALPGYLSSQSAANLAALNNILQPLRFLNGPQLYAVVQTVAIVKSWGVATLDSTKLSQISAAVGTILAAEATANALPNGGNTTGEGGRLVAALATLT